MSPPPAGKEEEHRRRVLNDVRQLVLLESGLPPPASIELSFAAGMRGNISARGKVWKALLGSRCDVDEYRRLLDTVQAHLSDEHNQLAKSGLYKRSMHKVFVDLHRTFKTEVAKFGVDRKESFERAMQRVLMAHVARHERRLGNKKFVREELNYVQGMNTVAGSFLLVMPEVDAFFCCTTVFQELVPLYVAPDTIASTMGLGVLMLCLHEIDWELYDRLIQEDARKLMVLQQQLLSFNSASPPLHETLRLWDFHLAFGMHLNILTTISRMILNRDKLLSGPMEQLNHGGEILGAKATVDADMIIPMTVHIAKGLSKELYQLLVKHCTDRTAKEDIKRLADPKLRQALDLFL